MAKSRGSKNSPTWRDRRLRFKREFERTFKLGQRVVSRHFVVVIAPGTADMHRLGLVVSRKVGKAVRRNYVKRCIRSFFASSDWPSDDPLDGVVIARPGALQEPDFAAMKSSWDQVQRRLRRGTRREGL